jgi:hypothetical protein
MNEKFKQLALQAKMGTADFDAGSYYVATPDKMQKFAELIVTRILDKVEAEIELADNNEQHYAMSTLQALALDILDEFDMELPGAE